MAFALAMVSRQIRLASLRFEELTMRRCLRDAGATLHFQHPTSEVDARCFWVFLVAVATLE